MIQRCFSLIAAYLMVGLLLLPTGLAAAEPLLVSSIRPLELIARDIMAGIAEPALLVPANADPHHLSLRVSERRLLDSATLLFWVGPGLEQPLAGVIGQLDAHVLTASEVKGLTLLGDDLHLWLDPANGLLLAEALATALGLADPGNASRYQSNLLALREAVQATDEEVRSRFSGQQNGFAVYHDAFAYFERHYGLTHALALTHNEALKPGLQQLRHLRQLASKGEIACLLLEPGIDAAEISSVTGSTGLRLVTADPLGNGLTAGQQHYAALIQATADAFINCLAGGSDE